MGNTLISHVGFSSNESFLPTETTGIDKNESVAARLFGGYCDRIVYNMSVALAMASWPHNKIYDQRDLSTRNVIEFIIEHMIPDRAQNIAKRQTESALTEYMKRSTSEDQRELSGDHIFSVPVSLLNEILQGTGYQIYSRSDVANGNFDEAYEHGCIMTVIPNRTLMNGILGSPYREVPQLVTVQHEQLLYDEHDKNFRRLILTRRGCAEFLDSHNHLPLKKTSWLGCDKQMQLVSSDAYIKTIESCFYVYESLKQETCDSINGRDTRRVCLKRRQIHYTNPMSPCIAPDTLKPRYSGPNMNVSISNPNSPANKHWYRDNLATAYTSRNGCRLYNHGYLYQDPIGNSTNNEFQPYILDPDPLTTTIIDVDVENFEGKTTARSTITVRVSRNKKLISSIVDLGNDIVSKKLTSVRPHTGDEGSMVGIGQHAYNNVIKRYAATDKLKAATVRKASKAAVHEYTKNFPSEMRSISQAYSLSAPLDLGDQHPLIFSVDLGNSSHEDTRDISQSLATWASNDESAIHDWYFLCPDIILVVDGITYHGLLIKLGQGVQISWDGRLIRHCTPKTKIMRPGAHAYSLFVCASGPLAALRLRDEIKLHC